MLFVYHDFATVPPHESARRPVAARSVRYIPVAKSASGFIASPNAILRTRQSSTPYFDLAFVRSSNVETQRSAPTQRVDLF